MWTFAEVRQEAENQGWDVVERPDKGGWVFCTSTTKTRTAKVSGDNFEGFHR
jgi:hypothetical protein